MNRVGEFLFWAKFFYKYLITCFSKYDYNLEKVEKAFQDHESDIFHSFLNALECCRMTVEVILNVKKNVKMVFKNCLILILYLLHPLNFNVEEMVEIYRTDINKLHSFTNFLKDIIMYNKNIYNEDKNGYKGNITITLEMLTNELNLLYDYGILAFDMESSDLLKYNDDNYEFTGILIC